MRQLTIDQEPDKYHICDDFLTPDHVGHITTRIEVYGKVRVDVAFTSLMVREPFVLSLELVNHPP